VRSRDDRALWRGVDRSELNHVFVFFLWLFFVKLQLPHPGMSGLDVVSQESLVVAARTRDRVSDGCS
jgi:hypothetical protein